MKFEKYIRSSSLEYETEDVSFQVLDIIPKIESFDYSSRTSIIDIFGVTEKNVSVLCHVHHFAPFFYVELETDTEHQRFIQTFETFELSNRKLIRCVTTVYKQSIFFFQNSEKKRLVCVNLYAHSDQKTLIIKAKSEFQVKAFYDADIPYVTQFMVKKKLSGADIIEAKKIVYRKTFRKKSRCSIEIDVNAENVNVLAEIESVVALRILSFDIECLNGENGEFPKPETNKVIAIANAVSDSRTSEITQKVVFSLGRTDFKGVDVFEFKNEKNMLISWAKFVTVLDPDVITGYNIQNFDIMYLITRAIHIEAIEALYLGRYLYEASSVRKQVFSSNQLGARDNFVTNIAGRVQIDMISVVRRDFKLRCYKLNSVAAHFLNETKNDVKFTEIRSLHETSDATRGRLAAYCMQDAILPMKLLQLFTVLVKTVEMARVTGITINDVLSRGQQFRVRSKLLRVCNDRNIVITLRTGEKEKVEFAGAYVISPKCNYYKTPIVTLDFVSLYPSIMMANNLCYSTLLTEEQAMCLGFVEGKHYLRTPSNDLFVKANIFKGLLPEILETLLEKRSYVKQLEKSEQNAFQKQILNGRQLALKMTANAVYGVTGAQEGMLPCINISRSVTTIGQEMLKFTQKEILHHFSNADVIYGDTDSVMVDFGLDDESIAAAMAVGRRAADIVTRKFTKPVQLDFEKVYCPFILVNKKRYVGLKYTSPEKHDTLDCKGLELVRRDNCKLVTDTESAVLDKLFIEKDPAGAKNVVIQTVESVKQNNVDKRKLIISKELTKLDYKVRQPHVELMKKILLRCPGSEPKLGDRVPYIVIANGKKHLFEKVEDPQYAAEHNLLPDIEYYVEKQLRIPLERLLQPVFSATELKQMFGIRRKKRQHASENCKKISDYFVKRIK